MITITRRQARRLRGVFRRHLLGIAHRAAIPPLVLRAGGAQLQAQYRYAALAIEHAEPDCDRPDGTIAVPLDALADFEGRDESAVTLEALGPGRTAVRWVDRGVPQLREYDFTALDTLAPFPEEPAEWTAGPDDLLAILAEASATTSEDFTRYALNCIQLRGAAGEVAATDGRQLLIRSGLAFPWRDDLLVRRSPLFDSRDLAREGPVLAGRTGTHVVLRAGPWTLHLEVQAEGRFPLLGHVVPDPSSAATRLRLDPEDVAFLVPALERLPGADEPYAPATLDLNGEVAVRARGPDDARVTELVLTRSTCAGTPVRLNTDRGFLARALRLGLTEIEVADADSPVAARDRDRTYCWQPLSKDSALEPTDDVTRIQSAPGSTPAPASRGAAPKGRNSVKPRNDSPKAELDPCTATNGRAAPEGPAPAGLGTLIQEAEALHGALGDVRARAGRLTVALRRYRRRERLVSSTLASLRALKLQEVAE